MFLTLSPLVLCRLRYNSYLNTIYALSRFTCEGIGAVARVLLILHPREIVLRTYRADTVTDRVLACKNGKLVYIAVGKLMSLHSKSITVQIHSDAFDRLIVNTSIIFKIANGRQPAGSVCENLVCNIGGSLFRCIRCRLILGGLGSRCSACRFIRFPKISIVKIGVNFSVNTVNFLRSILPNKVLTAVCTEVVPMCDPACVLLDLRQIAVPPRKCGINARRKTRLFESFANDTARSCTELLRAALFDI